MPHVKETEWEDMEQLQETQKQKWEKRMISREKESWVDITLGYGFEYLFQYQISSLILNILICGCVAY